MRQETRRVRPTIRCLEEDLGIPLPTIDVDLETIGHDLIDEARRIAPTAPQGQKRIQVIDHPLVYRIRHGAWRGATWIDEDSGIVWLLAAARREENSRIDAYEQFDALHREGRLLPTADDRLRDRSEAGARLLVQIEREGPWHLAEARMRPGEDHTFILGGILECRLHVLDTGAIAEIWLAVSLRLRNGEWANERLRDLVFVIFETILGGAEWEFRSDWPAGELRWFEQARVGLREG